jgi:hypothetical protein
MYDYDFHYDVDDTFRNDNDSLCRDLFADFEPKKPMDRMTPINERINDFELIFDDLKFDEELNQNDQNQLAAQPRADDECHDNLFNKDDLISQSTGFDE